MVSSASAQIETSELHPYHRSLLCTNSVSQLVATTWKRLSPRWGNKYKCLIMQLYALFCLYCREPLNMNIIDCRFKGFWSASYPPSSYLLHSLGLSTSPLRLNFTFSWRATTLLPVGTTLHTSKRPKRHLKRVQGTTSLSTTSLVWQRRRLHMMASVPLSTRRGMQQTATTLEPIKQATSSVIYEILCSLYMILRVVDTIIFSRKKTRDSGLITWVRSSER
jgi:hypothetical protein